MSKLFTVEGRWAWTAERDRLVPYESTDAAFLAFFDGQVITVDEAERVGLFKGLTGEVFERPDDAKEGILDSEALAEASGDLSEPGELGGLQILTLDEQSEIKGELGERPDDAEPGEQISGTTADGHVLEPVAEAGIMAAETAADTDAGEPKTLDARPETKPVTRKGTK
jgi:hypothetical protein